MNQEKNSDKSPNRLGMELTNYGLFICHANQFKYLKLIKSEDWQRIRLIWIAYNKNNNNNKCYFAQLPKDIIYYIIYLLQKSFNDNSFF